MKVLAFAASNSRNSINRALVDYAAAKLKAEILPQAIVEFLDLNDFEMPIYSIDRETNSGIPAEAQAFFDKIGTADAILISFAEHDGFVTAAWKNIFDWMSRIEMKLWQGKPMVMLAATPGQRAGAGVLGSQQGLNSRFGAELRGTLGIGMWSESWDAENQLLINPKDRDDLESALRTLAA
ncbi:MAG: NAD(P)H-dependent oxidoreductase [Pseudomonadota bacterium]